MSSVIPGAGALPGVGGASGPAGQGGPDEAHGGAAEILHLQAAILESLTLSGLVHLQEAFAMYLKGVRGRLVKQGVIDLTVVYQPLSEDASITREQAAKVLLLVSLYVDSVLKLPLAIPEKARAEMDTALQSVEDLPRLLPSLVQGVERRTKATAAAPPSETAPLPRLVEKKKPQNPSESAPAVRTPGKKATREKHSGQGWILGLLSLLIVVGIGAYWGRVYLQISRAEEAYRARAAALDLNALSEVLPLSKATEVRGTLMLTTQDDRFAQQGPEQQTRIASRLLRVVNLPDMRVVQIFSGHTTIFFQVSAGGLDRISSFAR